MRRAACLFTIIALTSAAAGAQPYNPVQQNIAAAVAPTITFYGTIVQKAGCAPIIISSDEAPGPVLSVGQAVDAQIDGVHCSGIVAAVATSISVTHLATVTNRTYTTTAVLK